MSPVLLSVLKQEGYTTPTPIQAQAIGHALEGKDLLGCAQTGTGKTAAFALPILHRLLTAPRDLTHRGPALPRALVLAPTRELACQIGESFGTYGRQSGLRVAVIYGGVSQFHQEKALRAGVDILVATPGRLIDLMDQRLMNFSAITTFVLDEADRMLDMGFIQPIRKIGAALPTHRQTMLFSATMPRAILDLAHSLLKNPVSISVTPVASAAPMIEQSVFMVNRAQKQSLLQHLLVEHKVGRAVVFTKTKHGADKVMKKLVAAGITAQAIHGNKAQNQRQRALDAFRSGKSRVLVATDVAARGLDVDGITHVFNFDLPMEPEAYVHRIGRTGRAGATGIALSFCDHEERGLLRDIERLTGKRVPGAVLPANLPVVPASPAASEDWHNGGGHRQGRFQRSHREGEREGWSIERPNNPGRLSPARTGEARNPLHNTPQRSPRPHRAGEHAPAPAPARSHHAPASHASAGHAPRTGGGMRSWNKSTTRGR